VRLAYALAIAAALIVVTMPGAREAQSQTSTPTATATATPTLVSGYSVDSFPRYSVNCFRLEASESISCLPGTAVPQ
jgi:hypothetical protein